VEQFWWMYNHWISLVFLGAIKSLALRSIIIVALLVLTATCADFSIFEGKEKQDNAHPNNPF
jgi:hypothetical protein